MPQPNQTTSHSPTPSTRFFFSCQCAFISFSCQCSRSRADAKHTASHPNDSCSPQTNRPNYQISTSLRATRTSAPAAARSPGGLSTSGRRPQGPGCIPSSGPSIISFQDEFDSVASRYVPYLLSRAGRVRATSNGPRAQGAYRPPTSRRTGISCRPARRRSRKRSGTKGRCPTAGWQPRWRWRDPGGAGRRACRLRDRRAVSRRRGAAGTAGGAGHPTRPTRKRWPRLGRPLGPGRHFAARARGDAGGTLPQGHAYVDM